MIKDKINKLWFNNYAVEHWKPVNKAVVSQAESLLVNSLFTEEILAVIKNKGNRNSKGPFILPLENSLSLDSYSIFLVGYPWPILELLKEASIEMRGKMSLHL
jgi:hypothetical protein